MQLPVRVAVREFESVFTALDSAVELSLSRQTARPKGTHWEGKWGEAVEKLENTGAMTYLSRRVN